MAYTAVRLIIAAAIMAASTAAHAGEPDAARGQAFAARHCARCHAIGPDGESPYSAAPPFRVIVARSPVAYMTRLLQQGLPEDHRAFREMQGFLLSEAETNDLAAYWQQLSSSAAPK